MYPSLLLVLLNHVRKPAPEVCVKIFQNAVLLERSGAVTKGQACDPHPIVSPYELRPGPDGLFLGLDCILIAAQFGIGNCQAVQAVASFYIVWLTWMASL